MTIPDVTIRIEPGERLYATHVHYHHSDSYALLLSVHNPDPSLRGRVKFVLPAASARKHLAAIRDACDAAEAAIVATAAEHAETVLDRAGLTGGAA